MQANAPSLCNANSYAPILPRSLTSTLGPSEGLTRSNQIGLFMRNMKGRKGKANSFRPRMCYTFAVSIMPRQKRSGHANRGNHLKSRGSVFSADMGHKLRLQGVSCGVEGDRAWLYCGKVSTYPSPFDSDMGKTPCDERYQSASSIKGFADHFDTREASKTHCGWWNSRDHAIP